MKVSGNAKRRQTHENKNQSLDIKIKITFANK